MMIKHNRYIQDILAESTALKNLLENFSTEPLQLLQRQIADGEYSHILISGMGSSLFAGYAAWLEFAQSGIPVYTISSAELLHFGSRQIHNKTLLWLNSQSGRSAEIIALLDRTHPGCLVACVNDLDSPLAQCAEYTLPIWAGDEATVSTKTFSNMLAVNHLAAAFLTQGDLDQNYKNLQDAVQSMDRQLEDWESMVNKIEADTIGMGKAIVVGRGASLPAAWCGALINKEAAKFPLESMTSADFRHGPLELIGPDMTVIVLAGEGESQQLNLRLAEEVIRYGGRVIWVGEAVPAIPGIHTWMIPKTANAIRSLVEMIPLQLLSIVLARRSGYEPGEFRFTSKITSSE